MANLLFAPENLTRSGLETPEGVSLQPAFTRVGISSRLWRPWESRLIPIPEGFSSLVRTTRASYLPWRTILGYPWLKIDFKNGGPADPRAYLQALLDYGLEGNIGADFYVEDNKVRKWYGM